MFDNVTWSDSVKTRNDGLYRLTIFFNKCNGGYVLCITNIMVSIININYGFFNEEVFFTYILPNDNLYQLLYNTNRTIHSDLKMRK